MLDLVECGLVGYGLGVANSRSPPAVLGVLDSHRLVVPSDDSAAKKPPPRDQRYRLASAVFDSIDMGTRFSSLNL